MFLDIDSYALVEEKDDLIAVDNVINLCRSCIYSFCIVHSAINCISSEEFWPICQSSSIYMHSKFYLHTSEKLILGKVEVISWVLLSRMTVGIIMINPTDINYTWTSANQEKLCLITYKALNISDFCIWAADSQNRCHLSSLKINSKSSGLLRGLVTAPTLFCWTQCCRTMWRIHHLWRHSIHNWSPIFFTFPMNFTDLCNSCTATFSWEVLRLASSPWSVSKNGFGLFMIQK